MQLPFDSSALPFIALYPEIHYRFFRWFPSLLFARQPEIVFDAPRRLDPGEDLPILLVANDLHRFPAEFNDCAIAVSQSQITPKRFDFPALAEFEVRHPFRNSMRAFILRIPRALLPSGLFCITCRITVKCGNKRYVVINDNLRTSQKLSFTCFAADTRLPGSEFCSYGDLHVHSQYSQSHVEFGPPLAVIDAFARACGLSFVAITDHSYDFACSMENYLAPDPGLKRWRTFQDEIINQGREVLLIPGEEVSCLNAKKEAVHLCGLGLKDFLPGTLDGARKNRNTDTQMTLAQAVQKIHEQNGAAFAAHPGVQPGFLQRLFLFRGAWSEKDTQCGIDAMQILNNGFTPSWQRGKNMWINMLRNGLNVSVAGGNDAHGDFNRYRALTLPFLSISENNGRYFGYGKTGVYGKRESVSDIVAGIRDGETFITTGPFAALCSSGSCIDSLVAKQPVPGGISGLYVHAVSTPEFGPVHTVEVYGGEAGKADVHEKKVFSYSYPSSQYQVCEKIVLEPLRQKVSYVRAEVVCDAQGTGSPYSSESAAYTSAVFLH